MLEYKVEHKILHSGEGFPKAVSGRRAWTEDETEMLFRLFVYLGYTMEAAARELGRTKLSVKKHLIKLRKSDPRWAAVEVPESPPVPKLHTKISRPDFLRRLYEYEQRVRAGQGQEAGQAVGSSDVQ